MLDGLSPWCSGAFSSYKLVYKQGDQIPFLLILPWPGVLPGFCAGELIKDGVFFSVFLSCPVGEKDLLREKGSPESGQAWADILLLLYIPGHCLCGSGQAILSLLPKKKRTRRSAKSMDS